MATKNNTKESERVIAVEQLRDANKEVKTISGVCKIIQKFWANGYNKAFKYFGLKREDFTPEMLEQISKKMRVNNQVCKIVRKFEKNEAGEFIKNKEGKRVYSYELKPIKVWSASTLWIILDQSNRIEEFEL